MTVKVLAVSNSDVRQELSRVLKISALYYSNLLNDFFSDLGLTAGQGEVLLYLYNQPSNAIETNKLLQFFKVSSASLSGILKKLKQSGYIVYLRDQDDARQKIISLTSKAVKCQKPLEEKMQQFYEIVYQTIDDLECKSAYVILGKLIQNISDYQE